MLSALVAFLALASGVGAFFGDVAFLSAAEACAGRVAVTIAAGASESAGDVAAVGAVAAHVALLPALEARAAG